MTAGGQDNQLENLRSLVEDSRALIDFLREHRLARGVPGAPPPTAATHPEPAAADSLEQVASEVRVCTRCRLAAGRTKAVPGEGPSGAELMVVGEGPGFREDQTGRPFVGEAGQMLTNMLERVVEIPRSAVFIANIVKCRPPNNRDPEEDEAAACRPFLERQIALVRPLAILCLGRIATHHLLETREAISRIRGRIVPRGGIEIIPTFHPAYLLRTPADKKLTQQDLLLLKTRLEALRAASGGGES